jgi:hypothetical protein
MSSACRARLRSARVAASLLALAAAASAAPRAPLAPYEIFRFSAGSTLFAPPGVGKDGAVYVGSGEGYVHALSSDGGYRWSYTVKGRVVAAPVEDPATGRVFVVTSDARLYALEADSHLRWVFPLPVAPKSELSLAPKGTLYFVGRDDYLYGVTTSGALVLRLAAPGARSAPVSLQSGQTGLVLGDSFATLKGYGYDKAPLADPFAASAKLVVAKDRAISSCEEGRARVQVAGRWALDTASDCLSAPVQAQDLFAVAEASGGVRLIYPNGAAHTVPLGAAPLPPIWDEPRRRLVLATATGVVSVVELPASKGTP